eukprot:CAMPEP_0184691492 /NCGR_PEP_ID=MMETSP0313-20130426/336_1 /TAXON_ID=2792 /ORGANISM="Porphyridium aerugineum, Strain SAG 1380-2" /LENGTH=228 /DNA_ID=CAMNT_0027149225 /DNA_START=124 /DNA_END=810 /DNA_ORIENTATION=+
MEAFIPTASAWTRTKLSSPLSISRHVVPAKPVLKTRTKLNMVFAYGNKVGISPEVETAKSNLLLSLKRTNLGRDVINDEQARKYYDELIQKVEAMNPSPEPVYDSNLDGKWRLVYADAEEILGTKRPVAFRPNDEIFQTIFAKEGRVVNEETFVIGFLPIHNLVKAVFEVRPPMRVNVKFEQFVLADFFKIKAPATQRGFLDITYLDHNMRISRGNKGHVFVLIKEDK